MADIFDDISVEPRRDVFDDIVLPRTPAPTTRPVTTRDIFDDFDFGGRDIFDDIEARPLDVVSTRQVQRPLDTITTPRPVESRLERADRFLRESAFGQIQEGKGLVGLGFAKFIPAVGAGLSEFLPNIPRDEDILGEFKFDEPSGSVFENLARAGKTFIEAQQFAQPLPTTAGAAEIEAIATRPFEELGRVSKPNIKKVLVKSGFDGTEEELENASEFIFALALIGGPKILKDIIPKKVKPVATETLGADLAGMVGELKFRKEKKPLDVFDELAPEAPLTAPERAIEPITPAERVEVPERAVEPVKPPVRDVFDEIEVIQAREPILKEDVEIPKRELESTGKETEIPPIERDRPAEVADSLETIEPERLEGERAVEAIDSLESFDKESNLLEALKSEEGMLDLEILSGEETTRSNLAKEAVLGRRAGIDIGKLDSQSVINNIKKISRHAITKNDIARILRSPLKAVDILREKVAEGRAEREAASLLIQGIKNPEILRKIGKENIIPLINNPTPAIRELVKIGKEHFGKGFEFMRDVWGDDLGYVDNYITQIWDIPKNKRGEAVRGFATKNPFTQKRKIPSIEEGIKLGFKPKTLDLAEIIAHYDSFRVETAFNKRFVDTLQNLKITDETTGKTEPLAKRADKAPADWVKIDHPALNRAKRVSKSKDGTVFVEESPIKVHPEIAKWVQNIFDKPNKGRFWDVMEVVNAVAKKGELSFSLFHHWSLIEVMLSSGNFFKTVKSLGSPKNLKAMFTGDFEIFDRKSGELKRNGQPVFDFDGHIGKDGIKHGITFGDITDVQRGIIDGGLKNIEQRTQSIPGVRTVAKGVRVANQLWDTALWDHLHNTIKLFSYEGQVLKEFAARPDMTPAQITAMKRRVAEFVNNSTGGQNWDLRPILGNPKMQQLMRGTLLSFDWTTSTLGQAFAVPKGIAKYISKGDPVLMRRSLAFWAKATLFYNLMAQSMNYHNTQKWLGEGRFTWENEPDKKLDIFIGKNPDGSNRYLRMGKQFREILEYAQDPVGKFGAKLAPLPREIMRQFTFGDPGSGFPVPWRDEPFYRSLPKRAISIAMLPVPFSLRPFVTDRPKNVLFAFPTSTGMSAWKARKLLREAIKSGNVEEIQLLKNFALENNLDANALEKQARSANKSEITKENRLVAGEINEDMKRLNTQEQQDDYYNLLAEKGILTPGVEKELRKIHLRDRKIKAQQERAGITGGTP